MILMVWRANGAWCVQINGLQKRATKFPGYTPLWVDKQIIKACLPKEEFFYGQKRFSLYD